MKEKFGYIVVCIVLVYSTIQGQSSIWIAADSIRVAHQIPAMGYAVISADSILEMEMLGFKKIGNARIATVNDPFRIGSNTKAITGLLAALLVIDGKLTWETKFFDLFPELRSYSQKAYFDLTLLDLLTFRTWLPKWSYTSPKPDPKHIQGNSEAQRMKFARWALHQKPAYIGKEYNTSNLSFVVAGLMLERAAKMSFEKLLDSLNQKLGIKFGIGQPNAHDTLQVWGHDANLIPEPPNQNVRLNWLMAAGNIQVSLHDYAQFLQFELHGLAGSCAWMQKDMFDFLFFCRPAFGVGWFWEIDAVGQHVAHNLGNPGTFLSRVVVKPAQDRAYVVLANCMSEGGYLGTEMLMERIVGR